MYSKWPNSVSIKVKNNFDFIENFTGFGKLHVTSDHENYCSWNKNSKIFSKIAQSVRGQTLYYCITHVYYEISQFNTLLYRT